MSVNRDRVLEILAAHGEEFRALGVKHLFLFGSLARGEATDASDVDVLVEYEPGTKLSFFRVSRLRTEIDREAGGRWLAGVTELPGVMCYGADRAEAVAKVQALALRVVADRLEHEEGSGDLLEISFNAA